MRSSLPSCSGEGGKSSSFGNTLLGTLDAGQSKNPIILEGGCSEQAA
jgi:hypothetical protein